MNNINQSTVPLTRIVDEFRLHPIYRASDYEQVCVLAEDVSRPGLQLAGFFEHFEPSRLQIIGMAETAFLAELSSEQRRAAFDRMLSYRIPALILSRSLTAYPECMEMAVRHDITVLGSASSTSVLTSTLISRLSNLLAPCVTRHGVFVEVYGEGVLLTGESGIGKSEAAIELVKRGHRLIADDAVEIRRVGTEHLVGTAPELIRHYIEIRGIGVINVAQLFGMGAIKQESDIDIVINIVPWSNTALYDRVGVESQHVEILGVKVPSLTIPVKPGRNLAIIVEVAAMEARQKRMGYNAAREFTNRINDYFDNNAT